MNEVDDGFFDWMIVLENKRKQREQQRELEKNAEIAKTPQSVTASPPVPEKAAITSPVNSTAGMLGSPSTPNVVIDNPVAPKSDQVLPETPQHATAKPAKVKWWQRLFCCKTDKN